MKITIWNELKASECVVLDTQRGEYTGKILTVKITHPSLKHTRWFSLSQAGNFYSRYTGKEDNAYADGYIIKGELNVTE